MEWLLGIAKSFFSSIIESIVSYVEKEKAEAAKWEAKSREKQLESIKKGQAIEKQIEVIAKEAKVKAKGMSFSDWNSGLLVLLCCLPLTGCFRFYVSAQQYQPVPPPIERPDINLDMDGDGVEDVPTERERALMVYSKQLEAAYNAVRENAKKVNEEAGFPVAE